MATLRQVSGRLPAETPTADEKARPAKASGEAINYVLMGSDSIDVGNAGHGPGDVLMVMHLAADQKSGTRFHLRATCRAHPGHGKNKINAAFAFGRH
jgi:polyisoprenyl-teichoic acid--peptidoglycan teichoic acid transferase